MANPQEQQLDLTVLVADDYAFIRHVIEESLTRRLPVKRIVSAASGTAALLELGVVMVRPLTSADGMPPRESIRISPSPINAVVTDFNMPGANGLHILQMIRTGNTGVPRDIPVIMLTGFSDQPLLAAALALDVDAFVTKPVAVDALRRKIVDALGERPRMKPVDMYGLIQLPDLDLPVDALELSHERLENIHLRRPQERQRNKRARGAKKRAADRTVSLHEAQPGWVLSADLLSDGDRVLLTKGTVLTESLIERLKELSSITGVRDVEVEEPAPASTGGVAPG